MFFAVSLSILCGCKRVEPIQPVRMVMYSNQPVNNQHSQYHENQVIGNTLHHGGARNHNEASNKFWRNGRHL